MGWVAWADTEWVATVQAVSTFNLVNIGKSFSVITVGGETKSINKEKSTTKRGKSSHRHCNNNYYSYMAPPAPPFFKEIKRVNA